MSSSSSSRSRRSTTCKISQIPPDAVTSSGSGLDPDISPQNAAIQVDRVAAARHLPVSEVQGLVSKFTQGRNIGFLGEPRVDVLTLNIALDELPGQAKYVGRRAVEVAAGRH